MTAVVVVTRKIVAARISGNPHRLLFNMAQKYLKKRDLAWNITEPLKWNQEGGIGPHVSLLKTMSTYKGEHLMVTVLGIRHYMAGLSRWVVMDVNLPEKFKCPGPRSYSDNCHVSIGQEKIFRIEMPIQTGSWRVALMTSYNLLLDEYEADRTQMYRYELTKHQLKARREISEARARKLRLLHDVWRLP